MFDWYWLRPRFLDEVCSFASTRALKRQVAGFAASMASAFCPRLLRLQALVCFVPGCAAVGAREWSLASLALALDPALFPRKQQIFLINGLRLSGFR